MLDSIKYSHIHSHILGEQVSDDHVEQYILNAKQIAKEYNCDQIEFWPYFENGKTGVRFGSDNFPQFAQMRLIMFGDVPNPGRHRHTQVITGDKTYQEKWVACAKHFLEDQSINFKYERLSDDSHRYSFDRYSHLALFFHAISIGEIEQNLEFPTRPRKRSITLNTVLPKPDDTIH